MAAQHSKSAVVWDLKCRPSWAQIRDTEPFVSEPTYKKTRPQPLWESRKLSENIVYVTDDTFDDEIIKAEGPVLVDYWADWCGPCKMIAPILDEIAGEYEGKLKIAKLNIDENPVTPPKFGIRGIPTLMLFKNGNVEATKVGAVSKSQLTAFIDSNL
jgi:thioredoxin 1